MCRGEDNHVYTITFTTLGRPRRRIPYSYDSYAQAREHATMFSNRLEFKLNVAYRNKGSSAYRNNGSSRKGLFGWFTITRKCVRRDEQSK